MRNRTLVLLIVFASLLLVGETLFGVSASRPDSGVATADGTSDGVVLEPVFGATTPLFNGVDLAGWNAFFGDGSTEASNAWSVRDGVLVCNGGPIGYLQTDLRYENFELVVEWRFDPERGAGNSGVLLRTVGKDTVWPTSIEAQLHSRNAGDIWNIGAFPMTADPARTKGRRTVKAHQTNEKPLGEWNRYRIRLDRGDLTLEVNGLVQNEATGCRQVPGRIGLQSEGAAIEFRRVELRPIVAWKPESK
ncbi:MAG: hypothetical protein CMJ27_07490 [Phycisphaerae bacterium]|nr:hypothetical protein [Phycisphaerae bacterium]OUX93515.1 MAG: hypothetical protein CBB77_08715 [Hyphomonas sp. TMED17]